MDGSIWSNGGMVLTGKTEVPGEKHYIVWVVDGWMVWSNGGMVLTGETEVPEGKLVRVPIFHYKYYMDRTVFELESESS
jgi:hypothetical protein